MPAAGQHSTRWPRTPTPSAILHEHARSLGAVTTDVLMDRQAAAAPVSDVELAAWARDQRIFISSVMASLAAERRAAARAIESAGATPVWFEDFGGRDEGAEAAYLNEVATSSIYLGILGRDYGRLLPSGFSPTHEEYLEARRLGLRISLWVQDTDHDGYQKRFIDDLRTFHTTGAFTDADDLADQIRRRLQKIASEMLSPWCKLGDVIFRATEIAGDGARFTIRAVVHDPAVAAALEEMRGGNWNRGFTGILTYGDTSTNVQVTSVETTVRAARSRDVLIVATASERGNDHGIGAFSTGTSTYTADDLVDMKLGEDLFGTSHPLAGQHMSFLGAEIGTPWQTFLDLSPSEESAEAIARLLLVEALVGGGAAARVEHFSLGRPEASGRKIRFEWVPIRRYVNETVTSRLVEGTARR